MKLVLHLNKHHNKLGNTRYKELPKIIQGCKNHNRHAQKELYEVFVKRMYNTAYRILKNDDDAADVVQDSFVEVFAKISNFRSEVQLLEYWIKRIVINKSINVLRKQKQLNEIFVDPTEDWDISYAKEEPENLSKIADDTLSATLQMIRDAMQELHEGYRLVLNLHLWEGYDHQEISEILNIQESTSRTQYMRGRKKLVEILHKKGIQYGT